MPALSLGIYLNSQYPEADNAAECLQGLVDQVVLAEASGFDSIWLGEHHLTPGFHYFPQLTLMPYLACYSGEMTLGTSLLVLPLQQPVAIAEHIAFIDVATGGRCALAIGQGYRRDEFDALGASYDKRLAHLVEGIEVLRLLWSGEPVDFDGETCRLTGASVLPGPVQPGGPPIMIGATTDRAIIRAARIGDGFMATPSSDNSVVAREVALFRSAFAERGSNDQPPIGRMLEVYCSEDSAQARRRAAPHLLEKYDSYRSWGLTGRAGVSAQAAVGVAGEDEERFADLSRNRFVIGDPDEVVEGLVEQHVRVGVSQLAMRVAWPGSSHDETMECIELLGRKVLPRVRKRLGQ